MDAFIGIGKMHWSDDKHEISWDTHHIHESRTSTSSGVDFFNTLKEITLLEEMGKPQMLFWEAQNASGRQADIRTLPDAFVTEK